MGNKSKPRYFIPEAIRNVTRQIPKLRGVTFCTGGYKTLQIPDKSIIYCDPPYANTTGYVKGLSHDEFWQWCRDRVYDGHKVYISEYHAPDDFIKIWEKPIQNCLRLDKKVTEKLFIYKEQF